MIDTLICGALTYTAVILSIAAGIGWNRSARENRRLKGWVKHWRKQAEMMAAALANKQTASRRGSRARACQVDQERARIHATAERLKAGQ